MQFVAKKINLLLIMLTRLHIQNYAIIDDLEIDFSKGLNIITGETGAGKSILMGALGLVLGDRADSTILQQKDKKCIVESVFNVNTLKEIKALKKMFEANEMEWEDELLIRREIATNGKSRAFINDTPVNLNQLKQLSSLLVDLHQQFDTLELGNTDFQREVLDALADNTENCQEYNLRFHHYTMAFREMQELIAQQTQANTALDYNKFLFDELEELGLKENELEELDIELKLLSNAATVKQQLSAVTFELNEGEHPVVQQLKSLNGKLHLLEQYHGGLAALNKRLRSTQIELQDIADEIESINEGIQHSTERIQLVNDRVSVGYRLLKKHNVSTTNELLKIKDALQEKLNEILNIGETIQHKEKLVKQLSEDCNEAAAVISANRKKTIRPFEERLNVLLSQVGMPNAKFKVQLEKADLGEYGADAIEFLFDANKSNRFEPLRKVASGGELSRLMLSIKSLVAKKLQLPTLIFDEIDSGISGEAAKQVGIIMKDLAASHQLIAITHQPQIAARATAHYFVYKAIKGDKIITSIRLLGNDERITVIAKMLSGEKPTAAALENAREMVGN